jgi:ABC-type multidrug transport system fused ATPase/permease subunit
MEGRLRTKLFQKISSFSYKRIEDAPPGDWLTRLNTDVQMPFSRPLHFPHAACAIVNICVSGIILWRMNPAVFGWAMLFIIPHIIVSQLIIARDMPLMNRKCLEAVAKNTGELTSLITCADIAVLYDGQDYLMKRFELSSLDVRRANMRLRTRNALSYAILPLFGLGGYLTLLIVCDGWIANGQLTFGDLTAAFQYRGGVLKGALMLINSLVSIQASMAGIRRLNETMSENGDDGVWTET